MTDTKVLKSAIKLIADAVNDSIKASTDSSSAIKLMEFQNLIPDVLQLIPNIGEIPKEAANLAPDDYAALLTELTADLALPVGKTAAIITASVKLLSDVATVFVPDIEALIAATK